MTSTATQIAGIPFPSYILNASGPSDATLEELEIIGRSGSAAIMTKSCTLEARQGNPEPRWKELPLGGLQSMGLPNLGYQAYVGMVPRLKEFGKPVIISIAGLCQADNEKMIEAFDKTEADLLELNLSCPNIPGKPQMGYDFEQSDQVLAKIRRLTNKPLGLKLPPYFDRVHQVEMAKLIEKHHINFISCINSPGNTLVIDPEAETPVIRGKDGFGGLSGPYVKPIALANVRMFYELLEGKVPIFGVGGVVTGSDAFEFLLAGASAVQVGTTFAKEGPECFERIDRELAEILERKGYQSIEEAKGKLRFL